MAIIGRRSCPWCGFGHAHVKQNEGKLPYHHCPDCGMMTPAKNGAQAALLKKGMGPIDGVPPAAEPPRPPATDNPIVVHGVGHLVAPPAAAAPAAPPRPAGLWDQLMRGAK